MNAVHTFENKKSRSYPNAADRRWLANKLADGILSAAICVGTISILFFLITMF